MPMAAENTPEDPAEGFLKLLVGHRIDQRVEGGVEITYRRNLLNLDNCKHLYFHLCV